MSGNHDDRHAIVVLTEVAKQVDAASVRKPDVEEAKVWPEAGDAGAKLGCRPTDRDRVTFTLQDHLQRESDVGFVIDNEDALAWHGFLNVNGPPFMDHRSF